jgi:hypothetical protein
MELRRLLGAEVVREAIVERAHDAAHRRVVELLGLHLLEEVVLDRVDHLQPQRTLVGDERVAEELGQHLRVTAEPEAAEETHQGAGDRDRVGTNLCHERGSKG